MLNLEEYSLHWIFQTPAPAGMPKAPTLPFLMEILRWAKPGSRQFRGRMNRVAPKTQLTALNHINHWRQKAGLAKLKGLTDPLLPAEVRQWAQLTAIQLAERMAKRGSSRQKRNWLLEALREPAYLKISESTPLLDECLDRILGINERKLKSQVGGQTIPAHYRGEDIYLELAPEDLFTPYRILLRMLKQLKLAPGTQMVDLGCGMGRVGIVACLVYPKLTFLGLELMQERYLQALNATRALKLEKQIQFQCADLSRTPIPEADIYYLFNPFSPRTLKRVFQNLYALTEKRHRKIRILMAEVGRPPRRVKREVWLKRSYQSPFDRKWRGHGFSIYESRKVIAD